MADRTVTVELVQYPPQLDGPIGDGLARVLSDVASRRVRQIERGYDHAHDDAHDAEDLEAHISAYLHRAACASTDEGYRELMVDVAALAVAAVERWDRPLPTVVDTPTPTLEQEALHWLRRAIGEAMGRTGEAALAAVTPRMLVSRLLTAPAFEMLEGVITSRWGVELVIASGNTVADVAAAIVAAQTGRVGA